VGSDDEQSARLGDSEWALLCVAGLLGRLELIAPCCEVRVAAVGVPPVHQREQRGVVADVVVAEPAYPPFPA